MYSQRVTEKDLFVVCRFSWSVRLTMITMVFFFLRAFRLLGDVTSEHMIQTEEFMDKSRMLSKPSHTTASLKTQCNDLRDIA